MRRQNPCHQGHKCDNGKVQERTHTNHEKGRPGDVRAGPLGDTLMGEGGASVPIMAALPYGSTGVRLKCSSSFVATCVSG